MGGLDAPAVFPVTVGVTTSIDDVVPPVFPTVLVGPVGVTTSIDAVALPAAGVGVTETPGMEIDEGVADTTGLDSAVADGVVGAEGTALTVTVGVDGTTCI